MRELLESAERWTPRDGESVEGVVIRLLHPGAYLGRSVLLRREDGAHVLADAHPKEGHAVLARELERAEVIAGDRVRLTFNGWRANRDGERRYRSYSVAVLRI
ncbi:MAG TPA: hypothetical protein VNT32_02365 [Thermoleophilaceae bacterium]|nr:hypothetical protein [Thermoleophilaceae bacterium]